MQHNLYNAIGSTQASGYHPCMYDFLSSDDTKFSPEWLNPTSEKIVCLPIQLKEAVETSSIKNQINFIKKSFDLNISELASILLISRPTVYEWLEMTDLKLRKEHQNRLEELSYICSIWRNENIRRLGNYLYRKIDNNHAPLFDLLSKKKIDTRVVISQLHKIANLIQKEREAEIAHEQVLKAHGFREITTEEMKERLNNSVTTIG